MVIKINNVEIAKYPNEFTVTPLDIDDGDSSVRTADGTLSRDRVAVKRQIEMSWNALDWPIISTLLKSMQDVFFDVYYPDPLDGVYATKTFYVGNRPATVAKATGNSIVWTGLKVTLTEK